MFGFDDFVVEPSCFPRGRCCPGPLGRLLERRRVLCCADRARPDYRQGCTRADRLWSQYEAVFRAFGGWQAFQAQPVLEFNHEAFPRATCLQERPDVRRESSLSHCGALFPRTVRTLSRAAQPSIRTRPGLAVNLEAT